MRLGLARGGVQVKAQDMQHAQEGAQVFGSDGRSLQCAYDLAKLVALVDGLLRNEPIERQPPLELFAVNRAPRAVEQADEVFEKRVRAAQRDEDEAIMLGIERIGLLEVFPEIANRLTAFLVGGTDSEATLYLPDEPCVRFACPRTDNEEVVGIEAEMLGLEMDFGDASVGQNRRDASDEELDQPVRRDMLLEEHSLATSGDRTGNSINAWLIHTIHQSMHCFIN